jgi:hypothetical protein
MGMRVEQVSFCPSKRYPWTHRLDFGDTKLGVLWGEIQSWSKDLDIPGVWVGSIFYTNDKGAMMFALRWP